MVKSTNLEELNYLIENTRFRINPRLEKTGGIRIYRLTIIEVNK